MFCVFHLEPGRGYPHLYTMMCGMKNRGIGGWMVCFFVLWIATAEAQRSSVAGSEVIYLPDSYDGEKEITISGGCQAAAVGGVSAPQFFISASRPYFISGWNRAEAGISFPLRGDAAGGVLGYEGFEAFRKFHAGIVYAKKLADRWLLGAGFGTASLHIAGNRREWAWAYRLAVQYRPVEKMVIATEISRPATFFSPYQEHSYLPSSFRVECWLRISASAQAFMLIQKSAFSNPSVAIVLRYMPDKQINIRLGIDASVSAFWLGAGWKMNRWRIEVNAGVHPYLGASGGMAGGFRKR